MATMEDIAKKLGVTKGTVSKALSGAPDVSESMRAAVVEAAVEMGYNRLPRSGQSKKVCIFAANMAYRKPEDFGFDLIGGFRKLAEPKGYLVDVVPMDTEWMRQIHYDEYMMGRGYVGGFFLGSALTDPWMRDFLTCRTATVLYDNRIRYNPVVASVSVDNEEGMDQVVSALKGLGHRKIGYLSAALGSYVFQQRYSAFFHAMRQHGLAVDPACTGKSYYTSEHLENHLPRLLNRGCTAIVCSHDAIAQSVMIQCTELGVRIPEDVSVVGFDDIPLCRYTTPSLSSVRQDREKLGRSAFHALSSLIDGIPIGEIRLHTELIRRDSIGIAPESEDSGSAESLGKS